MNSRNCCSVYDGILSIIYCSHNWKLRKFKESSEEQVQNFNELPDIIVNFTDKVITNYSSTSEVLMQNQFVLGVR